MDATNPKVDSIIAKAKKWQNEFIRLREIILSTGLDEDIKWGTPCYTYNGKNIILIHGFKEYCAVLFFKGSLLSDADKILFIQTENVQAQRQIRFTDLKQITEIEASLKAYIFEAIEIEKQGLKVEFKKTAEFKMPEEFDKKLKEIPALKTAFEALTPGRQRAYLLYFAGAKQAKTREDRIEKNIPNILVGKGLNE